MKALESVPVQSSYLPRQSQGTSIPPTDSHALRPGIKWHVSSMVEELKSFFYSLKSSGNLC